MADVNSITFTGLGSGIDLASIVEAMVQNETARYVDPIEEWKTSWSDKITAFQELNTKLASLHSKVKSLDTPSEFLTKTTTSSDESVLTASADSTSLNSSYSIVVNQLAKAEKETHSGHADNDTTAVALNADGTFSYTYNGATRTLSIAKGTTLEGLKDIINNDSQNAGVTATILNDGSGGATAYHLVLSGDSTGATYAITNVAHTLDNFATGGTTPGSGGFSATQTAQNAQIRIDGYPAGGWIERSANTINDAVTGMTFSLVGSGSATVTVTTDTASIKSNIIDFVAAFNEIRDYIKEKTSYNTDTDTAGILLGNYAVDTMKNRLNEIIYSKPSGFRDGYDTYIILAQIGIYTDTESGSDTEGKLIIDEEALDEALANDSQAVSNIFSEYFTGRSAHEKLVYEGYIDTITEAGTYEIKFTAGSPPSGHMRLKGTAEWHDAVWESGSETLTGDYGYPEAGLVVKITDTSVSFTGEIDLKRGIAGDLKTELDLLTDSEDGPLAVLERNYQDIIDSAQNKIEREEKRISLLEERLKERYARLEQLLSELNGQSEYISNRVAALSQ